jgi:sugar lactone lactonase YvrE
MNNVGRKSKSKARAQVRSLQSVSMKNPILLLMLVAWVASATSLVAQPVITQQPVDQVATNGGTATFSVTVSGTGPFTYQWLFNAAQLSPFITTVAGNGSVGYSGDDVAATNASLYYPNGVAVDAAGNLFIADYDNSRIRKVDTNGIITTVAGNGNAGYSGDDVAATDASLAYPNGVAVDAAGNLFIADSSNSRIRKVDTHGIITTVAGNGNAGYSGDNGAATNASINYPFSVTVDGAGNLFIADYYNYRIRKVDTNGIITTVAGNGNTGYSGDNVAATNTSLYYPSGVAVDAAGNLFIADNSNSRIRKVDTHGIITTVAGNGNFGYSGDNVAATNASLYYPNGVAVDGAGDLFIADYYNQRLRRVDTNGVITTVAGNGSSGFSGEGNVAALAALSYPSGVAVDSLGNLFIADSSNSRIRKVYAWPATSPSLTLASITTNNIGSYSVIISDSTGSVTSSVAALNLLPYIAMQPSSQTVWQGLSASFTSVAGGSQPCSYQWSCNGTNLSGATNSSYSVTNVVPADAGSYAVIVTNLYGGITSSPAVLTVAYISQQPTNQTGLGGATVSFGVLLSASGPFTYQWQFNGANLPVCGIITPLAGGTTIGFFGDGGLATTARLNTPHASAVDRFGNVFIADYGNYRVRRVDTNGIITTVAGKGTSGFSGDGGQATNAAISNPAGVAVDGSGNLFIADYGNQRIRRVDPSGIITTVAGKGTAGFSGDGNQATNAALYNPSGVAVDAAGNLFIADYNNNRIRKVATNGIITTVAGIGTFGFSGDGDLATSATLRNPDAVAVDSVGNLYIADYGNYRIRKVDTNGIITTAAGRGSSGFFGDGGTATNASISNPLGVAVDSNGNLFIADNNNNRIREVWANGIITTAAGNGTPTFSDGGFATNAGLAVARGVTVDSRGNLFVTDSLRVHKIVGNPAFSPVLPTLTLGNISAANAGYYSVVIRNASGSITSAVVSLTVQAPPAITVQPASQMAGVGGNASFSVGVVGSGPFGFALYAGGTNLVQSGTNSAFTLSNLSTNDAGSYTVVITNAYGSVTSQVAVLSVVLPPTITAQPASQTNRVGTTVSFSVAGTGTGPFSYQWQFNGTNLPNNIITTVTNLYEPYGLAFDGAGNLFMGCYDNRVRRLNTNGALAVVAGTGSQGFAGDYGYATNATLNLPQGVVVDKAGNLFIADLYNYRVRKIGANGVIATVAGNGSSSYSGDGGLAISAGLGNVSGLTLDNAENLYITCFGQCRVRKVDRNGTITTVAGKGTFGYTGDGGPATSAALGNPQDVAFDRWGNLFIAEMQGRVRKVDTNGTITTVAGRSTIGYGGDGGMATNALLNNVGGIKFDRAGNLLIADANNNRVRKVDTNGIITTVAGNGLQGYSGDGGAATNARLYNPYGLAVDGAGNLFIADFYNSRLREVHFGGFPTLSLTNVSAASAGNYSVVVSSPYGSVTSSIASLTLAIPPYITSQPTNQQQMVGGTANFSVTAGGSAPLSYQWYFSNPALQTTAGAYALDYYGFVVAAVVTNGGSGYTVTPHVQVVGGEGTGAGGWAAISNGMVVAITITNAGYGYFGLPLIQIDPPNGLLPGQTDPLLSFNVGGAKNAGSYFVVITNSYGSVTSSPAALAVFLAPLSLSSSSTNGQLLMAQVAGPPGYSYILQSTTNLTPPIDWQAIATNTADATGSWSMIITNLDVPCRFYRTSPAP